MEEPPRLATKALILSPNAGSMTPSLRERLRREFSDHLVVEFDPVEDFTRLLTDDATVVVAGGDGTVGHVARMLADTAHPVGILGLGTFNNFARALGIPEDLDEAIRIAREGTPRPVTLGRVNGRPFLEAAAVGAFGEVIELGESLKDLRFGELGEHLRRLLTARPFHYRLSGDITAEGTALSLVFANTPSTGARLRIAEGPLTDPYLELSVHVGESRRDIAGRVAGAVLLHRHQEAGPTRRFRRLTVETTPAEPVEVTDPMVRIYGDNREIGRTPATIEADLGGLRVLLP
jgi:diacylglycerol kinase family enzyme